MGYWQDKRVLVTGGAGFIGSYLVEYLVENGARVGVVDNLERGARRTSGVSARPFASSRAPCGTIRGAKWCVRGWT